MRSLKSTIPALLLAAATTASAWVAPKLWHVCSSAPEPSGPVTINVDVTGPEATDMTTTLYYSLNNQATWQNMAMSAVGEPGYTNTFSADITMPSTGTVYYYIAADSDSNWATQSPYNSGNSWPPALNLLTRIADEGPGDTVNNPDGPFLDLTNVWMGYSDTHFYARVTNNDDEWPIKGGILGPWYLYAAGYRNPDAPQDTWTFAMAYGNVLSIYTTGLYQINSYTYDFEKFADIDHQISGNTLHMRCAIADLTGNPRFGPWPNSSGYLRSARGDTRSVDIGQNNTVHDTTNYARWYVDRTPKLTVGQNTSPELDQPRIFPPSGAPDTEFRFQVNYSDADTNLPVIRTVVVDEDTLRMTPSHHRYWEGPTYTRLQNGFQPGWHTFRFVFDDGMAAEVTDVDSFEVVGTGVEEFAELGPGEFSAAPNPFGRRISFHVPRAWGGIDIHAPDGRLVRKLLSGAFSWDGRDEDGRLLPAGVYFVSGRSRGSGQRRRIIRIDQ